MQHNNIQTNNNNHNSDRYNNTWCHGQSRSKTLNQLLKCEKFILYCILYIIGITCYNSKSKTQLLKTSSEKAQAYT